MTKRKPPNPKIHPPPPRETLPLDLDGDPALAMPESVGTATMLADGTLQLQLRTVTADGMIGEALLIIRPGDERYATTLAHLGALTPGHACSIKPFPEPTIDPESIG